MNFTEDLKRNTQSRYANYENSTAGQGEAGQQKRSRINFSPLKSPLESAINKVVTTFGSGGRRNASPGRFGSTPKAKYLASSHCSNNINNFSVEEYDEDKEALAKMHPQAMEFLKKYFSGYSASQVPTVTFVDYLTKEFSSLWTESQASGKPVDNAAIIPEFTQKLLDRLGQQYVQMSKLCKLVKDNGLIGLILGVFRDLKQEQYMDDSKQQMGGVYMSREAPSSRFLGSAAGSVCSVVEQGELSSCPELQNVKNIIQEFTEGLYKSTENEIYSKLNGEMRRLVMKYKETEGLLKTVNDRINEDIDKLTYERKKSQLEKTHELAVERLNDRIKSLEGQLQRERIANTTLRCENEKYAMENRRLNETVDKFQNHLLGKDEPRDSEPKFKQGATFVAPSSSTHQQGQVISFAYQNPHPPSGIYGSAVNRSTTPVRQQSHIVENRKPAVAPLDKQNVVTLNTLNGVVRPTTPLKGAVKPSASPNRFLKVPRN